MYFFSRMLSNESIVRAAKAQLRKSKSPPLSKTKPTPGTSSSNVKPSVKSDSSSGQNKNIKSVNINSKGNVAGTSNSSGKSSLVKPSTSGYKQSTTNASKPSPPKTRYYPTKDDVSIKFYFF